jgi:UDP-glucose 4-epimerase
MKVLITGGAGFIGSNLADYLIDNGHNLIIVDDLITGHQSNLINVLDKIEFYEEKVEHFDFERIEEIDAIVHLAAQPSVPLSISDFVNSSSSNLLGTIKVIDYCRVNSIPLIYASSSALYGDLELGDDQSDKIDLLSPYATDKFTMELYCKIAHKLYQLSSIGLRFFNVYGPRQDPNSPYSGVISIFADRLLKDSSIVINGGYQTRDFVYVRDVIKTIYRAINRASENIVCEVSNVLTGQSVTIDYLVDQMMSIVDVKVEKNYQDLPTGDPEQSDGTTEKMVELFNVKLDDFTKLDEGLVETIKFIRDEG